MEVQVKRLARHTIRGDYEQVHQLATQALVAGRSGSGRTVLILVAELTNPPWQSAKCVEFLIRMGADTEATDPNGDTPAHIAARQDNLRLLAQLPFEAKFTRNEAGLTPMMDAVKAGSLRCLKHLLYLFRRQEHSEQKARLLGMKNYAGLTALEVARSAQGRPESVLLIELELRLVMKAAHVIESPNRLQDEFSKLKELAVRGNIADLKRAVSRANADLPDASGTTVLMWAIKSGGGGGASSPSGSPRPLDESRISLLARMADPTIADTRGRGCLHYAAEADAASAIAILLNAGAWINSRDEDGRTPLMVAAASGAGVETLACLIASGADWCLIDRRGQSALALAEKAGKSDAIALLEGYKSKTYFDLPLESSVKTQKLVYKDKGSMAAWLNIEDPIARSTETDSDNGSYRSAKQAAGASDFYPVSDPQGLCLIINICRYDQGTDLEERVGSERDVRRARDLFRKLGFLVAEKLECTAADITHFLGEKALSTELASGGCLICFLMAHGNSESVLGRDGGKFFLKQLVEQFQPSNCQYLKDKPKLFIVQASSDNIRESGKLTFTLPRGSDILICQAAQWVSRKGPILVQNLCDIVERHYQNKDFESMLQMLSKTKLKTTSSKSPGNDVAFSAPRVVSCLSKKVCFDLRGPLWEK